MALGPQRATTKQPLTSISRHITSHPDAAYELVTFMTADKPSLN